MPQIACVKWTRGEPWQQLYSKWHIPRRKHFKHRSVAQHLSSFWICCFDFVYSSLSQSVGFILCCLNLFPTTVIPQHKRMKETQWKTQSFHLGHESITRAAFLSFFLSSRRSVLWTEAKGLLILTCLFPWQRQFWFPTRPVCLAFVVHVSTGKLTVIFMARFF